MQLPRFSLRFEDRLQINHTARKDSDRHRRRGFVCVTDLILAKRQFANLYRLPRRINKPILADTGIFIQAALDLPVIELRAF